VVAVVVAQQDSRIGPVGRWGPDKVAFGRVEILRVEVGHSHLDFRHMLAGVVARRIRPAVGDRAIAVGHEEGKVIVDHMKELGLVGHIEELEEDIQVGRSHLDCIDRKVRSL